MSKYRTLLVLRKIQKNNDNATKEKRKRKKNPEDGCKPNSFKNLDNDGSSDGDDSSEMPKLQSDKDNLYNMGGKTTSKSYKYNNEHKDGSFCYKVNKIMPYVGMVLIGICVIIYYYKNYNKLEFNTASHKKKNPRS